MELPEPEDLTVYDSLVENTEKDTPGDLHDEEPDLDQTPGSVYQ